MAPTHARMNTEPYPAAAGVPHLMQGYPYPVTADEQPISRVRPGTSTGARRYRRLFLAAVSLFAIGVVFTIAATAVPFILGHDGPTWLYLGAMFFTPLGFLLGLAYALLSGRPPRA